MTQVTDGQDSTNDPHPTHLVPGYETDLAAVGTSRSVDPDAQDDRPWREVHGLTEDQAAALVKEHGG